MSFELCPAAAVPATRLHAAFGAAFADYLIGPFQLPPAQWPQFLARQGVDLGLSRVAVAGGAPLAFCFVAPRPECGRWRLATMGAVPAARGSGAAPALLDDFLARAPGQTELECFERNERALRLYRGRGFELADELHGYQHTAPAPAAPAAPAEPPAAVDLAQAWDWLGAGCELPLQVTPRSLRALPGPLQAWRRGAAQLVFSEAAAGRLQLHSLVDRDPAQQDAQALVAALLARFPGHAVHVPQLQRQAVGGAALQRLGFERLPLHQLWLRRPASPRPAAPARAARTLP